MSFDGRGTACKAAARSASGFDSLHLYHLLKKGDVMYTVEIIWNREFTWSTYTTTESLQQALKIKEDALSSGDGARVKKARILGPQGEIVG